LLRTGLLRAGVEIRIRSPMKTYWVYIMASKSLNLYTGVPGNLQRGVLQHRKTLHQGFCAKYNINRLVYYETFGDIFAAIRREKE